MDRYLWLLLAIGGCVFPTSRDPEGWERRAALTAEDLARVAIKPESVERSAEAWSVDHGSAGWTLKYSYDHHGLSIDWQGTVAPSVGVAEANASSASLFGSAVGRMRGVELVDGPAPTWGEEGTCGYVQVSGHDIGFRCRGRSGRRSYVVAVYGVSPHGPGAPSVVLDGPLRAFGSWDPE